MKIKTLADAGAPLARVKDLIAADPDRFAASIAQIDRDLERRADELRGARERMAKLSGGDRLFVSAEVADYLDQLRELGVSERGIRMERNVWILMQAASPKDVVVWIAAKLEAIRDPEFRAICLAFDAAFDWSADDPRLDAVAERSARWVAEHQGRSKGDESSPDPTVIRLVAMTLESSPALDRLKELAKESLTAQQSRS